MHLFDFLYVEEKIEEKKLVVPVRAGPKRYSAPVLNVLMENTEGGRTVSWGEDGLDVKGIKERFPVNSVTGGTILEGIRFIGSFSARVASQTGDTLCLKFTETDKALRKRLAAGAVLRQR